MRYGFLVALLVACTHPTPPPKPIEHPVDAGAPVPVDASVVDAAEPDAAIPDAAIAVAAPFAERPAVNGPVTSLRLNATATIGGATVKFTNANHKEYAGGGVLGMWTFDIARNGAKREVRIDSDDEHFEAEIDAAGVLLVFRHVGYEEFAIVLAAKQAPKPLDDEACAALVEQAAVRDQLPKSSSHGTSAEQGIVTYSTPLWIGHCGQYTKRVWFTKRPDRR